MLHGDVAYLFILLCYIVFSIRLVYQEGNDARSDDGNDTCNDEQEQAVTNSTAHDFAFLAISNGTDSADAKSDTLRRKHLADTTTEGAGTSEPRLAHAQAGCNGCLQRPEEDVGVRARPGNEST